MAKLVSVRLTPELAAKLARMVEAQRATARGQTCSEGGVLRGLLQEAEEGGR